MSWVVAVVKFLRRVVSAVVLGVLFATGLRVSGVSGAPRQHGGWQPLHLPDPTAGDPSPAETEIDPDASVNEAHDG